MKPAEFFLFPKTWISRGDLDRILGHFGRLTICQAWAMEPPFDRSAEERRQAVKVLFPPEQLRPQGDLRRLLQEYLLWMRQNPDRGYTGFLAALSGTDDREEKEWEIRKMIRRQGKKPSSLEEPFLKWHLVLHLAREMEQSQEESQEILSELRRRESPLEEAIGEEASGPGPLDSLPGPEQDPFRDDHRLEQVMEAWLGLFGSYLHQETALITLEKHVFEYVNGLFEEDPRPKSESAFDQNEIKSCRLPSFSGSGLKKKEVLKRTLSEKRILFLKANEFGETAGREQ